MSAAEKLDVVSETEYLTAEAAAVIKHEYLSGVVYAMAGGSFNHALIAANILGRLYQRLDGQPCRPLGADMLLRVERRTSVSFYYPDVSVICTPNRPSRFQEAPTVLFEVLSRSTRRVDNGEKLEAYQTIPSLNVYALVEQEYAGVVLYRRTEDGFKREVFGDLSAVISLPEIGCDLLLGEIYQGVEFIPEPEVS